MSGVFVLQKWANRLANDVRNKRHKASALDRFGQVALAGGGESRTAARHDFAVRVKKLL
jgi:hypothetical protein